MSPAHRPKRLSGRKLRAGAVALCIALALVLATPNASMAAKKKQKLSKRALNSVARAVPFVPKPMLRSQIMMVAKFSKRSPNQVARATVRQVHGQMMQMMRNRNETNAAPAPGVPASPKLAMLPFGQNVGDIFYTPSSYWFIIFGHNGMYTSPTTIVQHPGGGVGQVVSESGIWDKPVFQGARIGRIVDNNGNLVSASMRQGAVDWAKSRIGDVYNKNPLNTFRISSGPVGTPENAQNCSQLIWAAYKTQGLDLDDINWRKNGVLYGWLDRMAIFPLELMQSSHVQIYYRL